VRLANGKPAEGTITLRAFHQGGSIVIEVSDDGGGLNRQKILSKARERGLNVSDEMSDQEVWLIIFEAGFSTVDVISDVSGRGVGMDVVKRNIQGMGGRVEIDSAFGVGTRISIRLPLTLAILDGMSIGVGKETFILPLGNILESLRPMAKDIKSMVGQAHVIEVRGEYLPVIALHELFNIQPHFDQLDRGIMVILEANGVKTALKVDELIGQQQVVIKSLESNYRKVPGISGATIMGDGKVALILDVPGLVRMSRQ
jgi:two-component system chemotaxis sensor kinase CheA